MPEEACRGLQRAVSDRAATLVVDGLQWVVIQRDQSGGIVQDCRIIESLSFPSHDFKLKEL